MAITIADIPEIHNLASDLFDEAKDLLRFMERVSTALGEDRLVDLSPDQKQLLLHKYGEFKAAAQAAASKLM